MSIKQACFALLASLVLAGCGGAYTVNRTQSAAPEQIRKVVFSPQAGNSDEVTGYITKALADNGIVAGGTLKGGTVKTPDADAVVRYMDVWRWDLVTYMQSININLYNAMTGQLIASGRWEDSLLHSFNRGESVSNELISQMLAKLNARQQATSNPVAAPTQPILSSQAAQPTAAKAADTRQTLKSRLEYEAWQRLRNYPECRAAEISSITGAGTSAEQFTFGCSDGRQITIVCRTSQGCS